MRFTEKVKRGIKKVNKRRYRTGLHAWVSRKDQTAYYDYLKLLTGSVTTLFNEERTYNPHQVLSQRIQSKLSAGHQELFESLVHSITLQSHLYRIYNEDQGYESTQEDVLSAARLLQLEISPASMLSGKSKLVYWELEEEYGQREFTIREATLKLIMTKSTMKRHVASLENGGYLECVRVGLRNVRYYQIR